MLRRHYDRVFAICRRMTGNDTDAADAAQNTLLAIVRNIGKFDGRARFSTWSYRIAVNACLDELRARRRRPVPGADAVLELRPAGGPPVDAAVADRIDVDAALAGLSPEFRAAVVLRDLCGLDYAEIGDVLGIPPGTVRSRIARGRAAVAAALGNFPSTDDRPNP